MRACRFCGCTHRPSWTYLNQIVTGLEDDHQAEIERVISLDRAAREADLVRCGLAIFTERVFAIYSALGGNATDRQHFTARLLELEP